LLWFFVPATAFAHPLGNYSINQYTLFELRGETPRIYYQVDIAEIPSMREMDLLDQNFDNKATQEEIASYLDKRVPDLFNNLELTLDGVRVPLVLKSRRMDLYEGVGSMPVFNIFLETEPQTWTWPDRDFVIEFRSRNTETAQGYREAYALLDGRFGAGLGPWKEGELKYLALILQDEKENPIFQSFYNRFRFELIPKSVKTLAALPESPDFSWTATAKRNPEEEMVLTVSSEPELMSIVQTIKVADAESAPAPESEPPAASSSEDSATATQGQDSPANSASESSPPESTGSVEAAAALEAGPKVTVAQGRRAAPPAQSKRATEMLNRVTDVLRTEELTPGLVLAALAISMVLGMGHAFTPGHGKTVMAAYLIGERGTMLHALALGIVVTITHVWSILALGVVSLYFTDRMSEEQFTFWTGVASGGIIVALGLFLLKQRYARYVLAQPAGGVDSDDHGHHHMLHTGGVAHTHGPGEGLEHGGIQADGEAHEHSHGVFSHSHVVETKDGKPPTYKSILWLGISGGIVPCPAAFIVLMLAINLGRLALGLILILSFSVGLAAVLVAIGIAVVRASGHVRRRIGARSRVLLALPVFSAALITILGIGLVVQTLIAHGVIIIPAARG
jgi:ABC-type nickel/cobalt efflux system permease component RcnA